MRREEQSQTFIQPKFDPSDPPGLNKPRRPFKGISLAFFLFFCGLLFLTHGFHKFQEYTVWDLIAVWTLSFLLLIPGVFFVAITIASQLKIGRIRYTDFPQLYN